MIAPRCVSLLTRLTVLVTLLRLSGSAWAETVWVCWYNGDTAVHCVLQQPDVSTANRSQVDALPAMAGIVRASPAKLAGVRISIPLFTPPEDRHFVRELADAVMCGSNRNCRVDYGDSPAHVALLIDVFDDALN